MRWIRPEVSSSEGQMSMVVAGDVHDEAGLKTRVLRRKYGAHGLEGENNDAGFERNQPV